MKHIFVTGGVVSGLGKGICAASLGRLLKQRGFRVKNQKFDPYFNVDPGTMSPFQHGEVFVTDDGAETDLDLGHYERFVDESLTGNASVSSGKVFWNVLNRERQGGYLGGTVQIIPHVTDEIKRRIYAMDDGQTDIIITEVGGTVGDIESQPYLEAIRQVAAEKGRENVLYIHVPLVVSIPGTGELKSKPTQHSVKELRSLGVQPDFIVCRSDHEITDGVREKIALFCDVDTDDVLACPDAPSIYEVPISLYEQGFDISALAKMGLAPRKIKLAPWRAFLKAKDACSGELDIAVVGKYVSLPDAYLSINEALVAAGIAAGRHVNVHLIDGEELTDKNAEKVLGAMDGILVPGGFGARAFEGKIAAARYARENNVPFLGICLGLQAAVCSFARDVCGLEGATSAEFADAAPEGTPLVIDLMPEQEDVEDKGGTMRLGAYPCKVVPGTRAAAAYGEPIVYERHRHRYEVNNAYRDALVEGGLVISGLSPDERLVEMIELPDHPFFVASQAHPEFKSRPTNPHPLFRAFVEAANERKEA